MKKFEITTYARTELLDITDTVSQYVRESGIQNGICTIFVPHTTAAVTINENTDPNVLYDITTFLNKLVPNLASFRHGEGNSDAHIKSSMIGCSISIIVENGNLQLGTWQGIFFCEFDGSRKRKFYVEVK